MIPSKDETTFILYKNTYGVFVINFLFILYYYQVHILVPRVD